MNSNNSAQVPSMTTESMITVNGESVDNYSPAVEYVFDPKRVFVLYSDDPDSKEVKKRARDLKKSWEKVFGEGTCEVAVLSINERVETLA